MLNRPTAVTRAGVRVSLTEYDVAGNVQFVTDANQKRWATSTGRGWGRVQNCFVNSRHLKRYP